MPNCQNLKHKLEEIKVLKNEMDLEFAKINIGEKNSNENGKLLERVKVIKIELDQKIISLKKGIIDALLEKNYKLVHPFNEVGIALAEDRDNQYYVINNKGEQLLGPYDYARVVKNEAYYIYTENGNWQSMIDKNGEIITETEKLWP